MCCMSMTYHYGQSPGRRFPDHFGAQQLPRRMLLALVPSTVDLGIKNAVFVILHQLVLSSQNKLPYQADWRAPDIQTNMREDVRLYAIESDKHAS